MSTKGVPAHPSELASRNCLVFLRGASPFDEWRFDVGDTPLVVRVGGNRQTSDGGMLRTWALEGCGIALKSIWEIAEDVRAGRLILVLDEFAREQQGLHLLTEGSRNLPWRVRAFVDFATSRFKALEGVVKPYL
ncbi:LysR substrate-binding domain-containing protein [Nostoc sp. NIES-2111]